MAVISPDRRKKVLGMTGLEQGQPYSMPSPTKPIPNVTPAQQSQMQQLQQQDRFANGTGSSEVARRALAQDPKFLGRSPEDRTQIAYNANQSYQNELGGDDYRTRAMGAGDPNRLGTFDYMQQRREQALNGGFTSSGARGTMVGASGGMEIELPNRGAQRATALVPDAERIPTNSLDAVKAAEGAQELADQKYGITPEQLERRNAYRSERLNQGFTGPIMFGPNAFTGRQDPRLAALNGTPAAPQTQAPQQAQPQQGQMPAAPQQQANPYAKLPLSPQAQQRRMDETRRADSRAMTSEAAWQKAVDMGDTLGIKRASLAWRTAITGKNRINPQPVTPDAISMYRDKFGLGSEPELLKALEEDGWDLSK